MLSEKGGAEHEAFGLAIVGYESHAVADGVARSANVHRKAVDEDAAGGAPDRAEQPFEQFGAAGACQAREADDFAVTDAEVEGAFDAKRLDLSLLGSGGCCLCEAGLQIVADHGAHELVLGGGRGVVGKTRRPSRITVTRSVTSKTSRSRCEM